MKYLLFMLLAISNIALASRIHIGIDNVLRVDDSTAGLFLKPAGAIRRYTQDSDIKKQCPANQLTIFNKLMDVDVDSVFLASLRHIQYVLGAHIRFFKKYNGHKMSQEKFDQMEKAVALYPYEISMTSQPPDEGALSIFTTPELASALCEDVVLKILDTIDILRPTVGATQSITIESSENNLIYLFYEIYPAC